MKKITNFNFKNQSVIIREDYNVPFKNNQILDGTKIILSLPSVNKILNDGGRVILISHLCDPNGYDLNFSLKLVFDFLKNIYKDKICFASVENDPQNFLKEKIVLLENLRFDEREKKNDRDFAEKISKWGTFYINDSFASIHRNHSSIVTLPKFFPEKKCIGFLFERELYFANKILNNSQSNFTIMIGGAKVSDKIAPLKSLINLSDYILLGGIVANTFLKSLGFDIGDSKFDESSLKQCYSIYENCKELQKKILFPVDFLVSSKIENFQKEDIKELSLEDKKDGFKIFDIGKKTIEKYSEIISNSKKILWSGPFGKIEEKIFFQGTLSLINSLEDTIKKNRIISLIGGGETGYAASELKKNIGYISTGGSALLKYIENQNLESIRALNQN
jgi:phosphoglycerate kinase